MSAQVFPMDTHRDEGLEAAAAALSAGKLVVVPTDTVYGIACDAFQPAAVAALLAAKRRDRTMPVPVLIGQPEVMPALASGVPEGATVLAAARWPGPLTLILTRQPTLAMDLGDAAGTIALRVPRHETTRTLLDRTGPLAVSSANISGTEPATTCDQAKVMLGEACAVYLDDGPTPGSVPSTIVDFASDADGVVLRAGAESLDSLRDAWPALRLA